MLCYAVFVIYSIWYAKFLRISNSLMDIEIIYRQVCNLNVVFGKTKQIPKVTQSSASYQTPYWKHVPLLSRSSILSSLLHALHTFSLSLTYSRFPVFPRLSVVGKSQMIYTYHLSHFRPCPLSKAFCALWGIRAVENDIRWWVVSIFFISNGCLRNGKEANVHIF